MFDGPDGVGKTTQIERLSTYLDQEGYNVHTTRAHGGTPMGEALREASLSNLPRTALTDYFISLAIHSELSEDTATRKQNGQIILVDRSPLSIWAYQIYGSGAPVAELAGGIDADVARLNPDLVICYRASLQVLRQHMGGRGAKSDYFESKPDDYFERVIEGYDFAAKRYGAATINAERSIDDVFADTLAHVMPVVSQIKQ